MDDAETLVLFASASFSALVSFGWYKRLLARPLPPSKAVVAVRLAVGAWPILLLLALRATLIWGAAREVRTHAEYVWLFVIVGAAWSVGLSWVSGWLGVHAIDDVIERKNTAAAIALLGTTGGGVIVYAGANLGEGDTIWTTIGPAAAATLFALALWGAHQMLSGAADAITLDRDSASAIRFAGMTLGTGLIIGRAVAGDYISAQATLRDLLFQSWPAWPLMGSSVLIHLQLRPTKERPTPDVLTRGLLPGVFCLGLGAIAVFWLDHWRWAIPGR